MPKRRNENAPFWVQMRQAERSIIEFALEHGQTVKRTAALLGISPNYLSERLHHLGIPAPESKPGPKPGTRPVRPTRPELRVVDGGASSTGESEDLDEVAAGATEAADGAQEGDEDFEDEDFEDEGDEDEEGDEEDEGEDADEDDDEGAEGDEQDTGGN